MKKAITNNACEIVKGANSLMFTRYMLSDALEFKVELLETRVLNHYHIDIKYLEPIEIYHIVKFTL